MSYATKVWTTISCIPELSSDLRMSDFLKVYPMKLLSLDVSICKSIINKNKISKDCNFK